jgi:hypothetical protein
MGLVYSFCCDKSSNAEEDKELPKGEGVDVVGMMKNLEMSKEKEEL